MIRMLDFNNSPVVPLNIPHRIISMEEAIREYRKGYKVGIIDGYVNPVTARAILMDNNTNFTCDFDYLVNCDWVVFG